MIPEIDALIERIEESGNSDLLGLALQVKEMQEAATRHEMDTHQHMWNAIHKVADACGCTL